MELVSKKPGERQLARLFQARGGGVGNNGRVFIASCIGLNRLDSSPLFVLSV